MSQDALQQLQAIHSMLHAGHRSIRVERPTLLLWGATGGFLTIATEWLITAERIPVLWQRALAVVVWLAAVLGLAGWADFRLRSRRAQAREETLSFVHGQVAKASWMLVGMGLLFSFAMFFFGGGTMIYCLWVILFGLGIYIHGLFSERVVEWIGIALILVGVAALAAQLNYQATRWLAASCFGIGLPLLALLLGRPRMASFPRQLGLLTIWLLAVIAPPLAALQLAGSAPAPEGPPQSLEHYLANRPAGTQVVRLPAGTTVGLGVEIGSPLLHAPTEARLPLKLDHPVDVVVRDGVPDGRYRIGEHPWHEIREGVLTLRIYRFRPELRPAEGAVITAEAELSIEGAKGHAK